MGRPRLGVVYQGKDGRWWARVRYTDELGVRRQKFRLAINKTDALDKRDELLTDLKKHGAIAANADRMTFQDLANYYQEHYLIAAEYRDERKIAGVRNPAKSKSMLQSMSDYFGKKRLRSLTYGDLRNYRLARLRSKSRRSKKADAPMISIATVNREMSLLRRLLSVAQQQRWLLSDLFKQGAPLITPADERPRNRVLTRLEEDALLAQCTGQRSHLRALIICGADTGMRKGEILKLRWMDVDMKARLILVRAMHTKTLRERQLGITPRLMTEFQRIFAEEKPEPEETIFNIKTNFKRSWTTACKYAGVVDARFHDLRHTFATRLLEAGMASDLVSRLLGHTQQRTTYRYVNLTPDTVARAVELLTEER